MNFTADKNNGRYILFLDILGFSNLVESNGVDHVYKVVDEALQGFERWKSLNKNFRTIYFSDTFLFYQNPKGYHDCHFLDIYAIGAMLLSSLLAKGIPARGAISFGEFEVRDDSSKKHQLYFGKALIEAYKAEQRENWIGITILPSAWKPWDQHNCCVKTYAAEGAWKIRHDEVLLLMPLLKLRIWYGDEIDQPYLDWDAPDFPNDLRAFHFLRSKTREFCDDGDFSGRVAVKYHSTMAFLREIMGESMWRWTNQVCDDELEKKKVGQDGM